MASRAEKAVDLWSEFLAAEEEHDDRSQRHQGPEITVTYRRHQAPGKDKDVPRRQSNPRLGNENRLSIIPAKRISWNRSLSLRGRTSIAVAACADLQPQARKPKRKNKPPLPKGRKNEPPNFDKERAYFEDVDSFELMEESPSPNKYTTWTMCNQDNNVIISHLSSVLQKWLISKRINCSYAIPASLSKILETPTLLSRDDLEWSVIKTPEKGSGQVQLSQQSIQKSHAGQDASRLQPLSNRNTEELHKICEENFEDVGIAVGKLSLTASLDDHGWDPFYALLAVCGQLAPSTFLDVLSSYCNPESISKVGEGTFGEAFKAGKTVCKIVPFDGVIRVNGEAQKKSEELLEEVILSCTLNCLRGCNGQASNACATFIRTIESRVCQGVYDDSLIRAWEEWDTKHSSENDHPKEFPEMQRYVVFVQEHGGQDLESFVLLNFDEARSLLVQVTLALAVAESAYEFEHRDLHWGNILLSRTTSMSLPFTLEGRQLQVRTYGLLTSIIDFTLSRINTGEDILFLDLSLDPELFEGPKGDKQSETYRKMKEVTGECWEGSFPKTNILWLQYLADILLLKKSYERTAKDERDLRSFKKRLNHYGSAKDAISDAFFSDLFENDLEKE